MLFLTDILKKVLFESVADFGNPLTQQIRFGKETKPIVVWNVNEVCNMSCPHCYANAKKNKKNTKELSEEESKRLLKKLWDYGVRVIIFSGGEPLIRKDIFSLIQFAIKLGFQCHLSTNGVLITKKTAKILKELGVTYVGVSIDGLPEFNDKYRGFPNGFFKATTGIRYLQEYNISTGIRITISKRNQSQLFPLLEYAEKNQINRFYISHLMYSGRGTSFFKEDLSFSEVRNLLIKVFDFAFELLKNHSNLKLVTGGNDVDGAFLYIYVYNRFGISKANALFEFLEKRGGNSAGEKIINIDPLGNVHPDQFFRNYTLGNLFQNSLEDIFQDELIQKLRRREEYLYECKDCFFLKICRGSHRERALFLKNDLWAKDPACYLTNEERSLNYIKEVKV
ncbi:MAG: radical SAM protein [Leptonema sp. (in: bacteria)]